MRRTPRRMLAAIAAMGMLAVGLTVPTAMAAEPVNGCKVYYPADTEITLATAAQDSDCWDAGMVSKDGRTFLGWSEERIPDITSGAEYTAAQSKIRTTIVMKAPGRTVYAVWTTMPTITYDANPPAGVENPPAAPVGITGEYNKPVSDSSGWKPGDTTLIPGYIFQGWTDTPNGNDTHDWSKPLTQQSTVVHAKWEAIGYKVRFDRNASDATGSMADQVAQIRPGAEPDRERVQTQGLDVHRLEHAEGREGHGLHGSPVRHEPDHEQRGSGHPVRAMVARPGPHPL